MLAYISPVREAWKLQWSERILPAPWSPANRTESGLQAWGGTGQTGSSPPTHCFIFICLLPWQWLLSGISALLHDTEPVTPSCKNIWQTINTCHSFTLTEHPHTALSLYIQPCIFVLHVGQTRTDTLLLYSWKTLTVQAERSRARTKW